MAKKKKLNADLLAEELGAVRQQLAALREHDATLTTLLKTTLHEEQRTSAGNYKITESVSLKVVDTETAIQWAATTNCLKVDVVKAKELLRHTFDDPSKFGLERVTTESVTPIKKNYKQE